MSLHTLFERLGRKDTRHGLLTVLAGSMAVLVFVTFVTGKPFDDCIKDCDTSSDPIMCQSDCYTNRGAPLVALPAAVLALFLYAFSQSSTATNPPSFHKLFCSSNALYYHLPPTPSPHTCHT